MANPIDVVTAVANATSKAIDLAKTRENRMNTAEMQENATRQQDQTVRDATTAAIAKDDLETLRKLNS